MMIKPKGRPSTQCDFCKQQRKIRNSHVKCKCTKKIGSKVIHDKDCPCHLDGQCTCCNKGKKSKKKDEKDKEKEKELGATTKAKRKSSKKSIVESPNIDVQDKPLTTAIQTNTPTARETKSSPIKIEESEMLLNVDTSLPNFSSQNNNITNIYSMSNDDASNGIISPTSTDLKFDNEYIDPDTRNSLMQQWDMSSPPMGNSESLYSLLSDNSYMNNSNNNPTPNNVNANSNTNNNTNNKVNTINNRFSRQIGLDPLQNFRSSKSTPNNQNSDYQSPTSPTLQRGLGEISIPVDEYMGPLNKMNVHFRNFLNTLTDQPQLDNIISPNSISPGQISNGDPNVVQLNTNQSTDSSNGGNNRTNSFYDFTPATPGNGLLDIFENNVPTSKVYQNQNNQPSKVNEPDSLFPLFPLIGPLNTDNDLSQSNVQNLNSKQSNSLNTSTYSVINGGNMTQQANPNQTNKVNQIPTKMLRNTTGSSLTSSTSYQSLHSNYSTNSLTNHHNHHHNHHHQPHHNGSHGHTSNSHFHPYQSSHAHRSSSFLALSPTNSYNSSTDSLAASFADVPQLLTAEDGIQGGFTGEKLANAKTNTTLMDDIYTTKTYTDSHSINAKRLSQNAQQIKNHSQQIKHEMQDDMTNGNLTNEHLDLSIIGSIPNTSTLPTQQNAPQTFQYEDHLIESLLQNDF